MNSHLTFITGHFSDAGEAVIPFSVFLGDNSNKMIFNLDMLLHLDPI